MSSFPSSRRAVAGRRARRPSGNAFGPRLLRRSALVAGVAVAAGLGVGALPIAAQVKAQGAAQGTAAADRLDPASFSGIGREATAKEIAAWDIDVRPDFKGLPKGEGSVQKGQEVWESKCESCHGTFGESNQVFAPLVGGTTPQDIETGRVARLKDANYPGRTTLMKAGNVSALWDYINRAMPWNHPKSLSVEEVYAVTAYLLNMGSILPDDFVMSDRNIGEVQGRMPNRNGFTTDHGLWPGKTMGNGGRPDVQAVACMTGCATEPSVASILPDYARSAHGNLAEQNRLVGPQRGADTAPAPGAAAGASPAAVAQGPTGSPTDSAATTATPATPATAPSAWPLAQKHACSACHAVDRKLVGPSFQEVAAKYRDRADARAYLAGKIRTGGQGVWGVVPMPPQNLPEADADAIAAWLKSGAKP